MSEARAHWLARDIVAWDVAGADDADYALVGDPGDVPALTGGAPPAAADRVALRPLAALPSQLAHRFPHLARLRAFQLADPAGAPELLRGRVLVAGPDGAATGVQTAGVLDDLYANDEPLGIVWDGRAPGLRVWAPTARSVALALPDGERGMARDPRTGVWSIAGEPSWRGLPYRYAVEVYAPATGQVERNLVTDPYAVALTTNSTHSVIADLADPALAPPGWAGLAKPEPADPVIYELHIRDFSINDRTVPAPLRGTYGAFTCADSDGMRHLRSLAQAGLTHVHLLPAFDFATVDDDRASHRDPGDLTHFAPASTEQQRRVRAVAARDGFNWGYDPLHYTVPDGSYAQRPDGPQRTREFRAMVAALNAAGLRVVLDVVYNHTTASGQDRGSVLDRIVPGYYHRLLDDGRVANSTCCANTAAEHRMFERLMLDSLVSWARDYKVDGFRFDLMGHHPKAVLLRAQRALAAYEPLLYGEGWDFGEVAGGARFVQATQEAMAGTGVATFDDRLRDAVRGGGPADADPRVQGFASGLACDPNGAEVNGRPAAQRTRLLLEQDRIKVALAGGLRDIELVDRHGARVAGEDVDYHGRPAGYALSPRDVVSYVEAHDNETLFDALAAKLPRATPIDERVRAQVVALSLVALGQGIPFFHAGGELLRSKSFDRNSYDSGDWFNRVFWDASDNGFGAGLPPADDNGARWTLLAPYLADPALKPARVHIETCARRFRELLAIRASSRAFRLGDADEVRRRVRFHNAGPDQVAGLIVMEISGAALVAFNAGPREQTLAVAGPALPLHPVQQRSDDPALRHARRDRDRLTVPARTTTVFAEP